MKFRKGQRLLILCEISFLVKSRLKTLLLLPFSPAGRRNDEYKLKALIFNGSIPRREMKMGSVGCAVCSAQNYNTKHRECTTVCTVVHTKLHSIHEMPPSLLLSNCSLLGEGFFPRGIKPEEEAAKTNMMPAFPGRDFGSCVYAM